MLTRAGQHPTGPIPGPGPHGAAPAACDLTPAQLAAARQQARQTAATLITAAAPHIREHTCEPLIRSPRGPGKGEIHIGCADSAVPRERTACDDRGHLPGYLSPTGYPSPTSGPGPGAVTAAMIHHALNAPQPSQARHPSPPPQQEGTPSCRPAQPRQQHATPH
ncbi:MAG: hypothetical protein ACRDNF_15615, partial [Streptosporangiaceae bacterium]